jgi:hypothetical protein
MPKPPSEVTFRVKEDTYGHAKNLNLLPLNRKKRNRSKKWGYEAYILGMTLAGVTPEFTGLANMYLIYLTAAPKIISNPFAKERKENNV